MSNIIFAIPRTDYPSYQDLYKLIELSGYQHIFVDEIDATSDNAYILTCRNGELGAGWPDNRMARIVLWDFEHRIEPQPPISGITDYWHMDAYEAKLLGYKYVPCGGHEGLAAHYNTLTLDRAPLLGEGIPAVETYITPENEMYDTAYIGYLEPPRRARIAQQLRERQVNAYIDNDCWRLKRHRALGASRSYLSVHQLDTSPAVPALRMVVAAAYSLPFITETCANPGIFANHILSADYAHLADFTAMWARERHTQALDEKARGLHQLLCNELTFRKSIERAL